MCKDRISPQKFLCNQNGGTVAFNPSINIVYCKKINKKFSQKDYLRTDVITTTGWENSSSISNTPKWMTEASLLSLSLSQHLASQPGGDLPLRTSSSFHPFRDYFFASKFSKSGKEARKTALI